MFDRLEAVAPSGGTGTSNVETGNLLNILFSTTTTRLKYQYSISILSLIWIQNFQLGSVHGRQSSCCWGIRTFRFTWWHRRIPRCLAYAGGEDGESDHGAWISTFTACQIAWRCPELSTIQCPPLPCGHSESEYSTSKNQKEFLMLTR